jgi:outer membrane protein
MKKLVIIWALASTLTAVSQEGVKETAPAVFSLQQAIDYALLNQKDVKNAIIEEQIAKQKVKEVAAVGLPQINSGLDLIGFIELPTQVIYGSSVFGIPQDSLPLPPSYIPFQMGTTYKLTASVDATQLLFSGEYLLGLQASKVYVDLTNKSTQKTKIDITAAVTKAYYTVLINEERKKLLDANVSRLKRTLDETRAFFDNGLIEKIDFDRLTVTYNNLLVEQERVNRLLGLGIYLLKCQIGMEMQTNLTLTDKLADLKLDIGEMVSAEKFEYSKRVEYRLFETQLHLARLDFKRNKVAYLPTAAAYANYSTAAMRQEMDFFNRKTPWYYSSFIGAKLSLPIFTGLQRNARYQQANLKIQQAENNMNFIRQSIDLEVASSLATLQNASSAYNIQKKNIEIAEEVVRVAKIKYDQGVGSNLELVTAETSLKEAQTNYYNALFEALVAKIDFDKANGNIK